MIFRSEEDVDRTLDEFVKARRAWPLYLARSVRLRSPVIGNLAGRRSKENPAAQRRRRGSRPSSTALQDAGLNLDVVHRLASFRPGGEYGRKQTCR
jgi:hypothetical protein